MCRLQDLLFWTVLFNVRGLSDADFKYGILRIVHDFNNKLITSNSNVIDRKYSITSLTWCAVLCFSEDTCVSFFYLPDSDVCQMHSVLFVDVTDADDSPGTVYFQITEEWCPVDKGYVVYRSLSLCYKVHPEERDHAQARAACQGEGGSLAVVRDETISTHLFNFLRASSSIRLKHYQIGADDVAVEGTLVWADGTPVTWTNWADGEPSHTTERCTSMAWFYYFRWNDIPCSHAIGFLCQIGKP